MAFNTLMHERNMYKVSPNFEELAEEFPEFKKYVYKNPKGKCVIDFTNTEALRSLTKTLLKKDFDLEVEIPKGFLVPTIPQRLNYILWVEDLISEQPGKNTIVKGIDVGTGTCCIFPLLGAKKNGWQFLATESSAEALEWARKNINANFMQEKIEIVKVHKDVVLKEVISTKNETFDFCLCNPPFFENIEEIKPKRPRLTVTLDKQARHSEILVEGGEISFIKKMIQDSLSLREKVRFYTSMLGRKSSLIEVKKELKTIPDIKVSTTMFCQGNTIRWGDRLDICKKCCIENGEK